MKYTKLTYSTGIIKGTLTERGYVMCFYINAKEHTVELESSKVRYARKQLRSLLSCMGKHIPIKKVTVRKRKKI